MYICKICDIVVPPEYQLDENGMVVSVIPSSRYWDCRDSKIIYCSVEHSIEGHDDYLKVKYVR